MSFIILLLIMYNSGFMNKEAIQETIPLETYEGKWYINMSTFPMWLKGNKTSPSFNYTIETNDSTKILRGDVQYLNKNGKLKHIKGTDKPVNIYNTAFEWRGKGFLHLFKSDWEIIAYDQEQQWAIMHFQKTLVSPEGYDLFSRQKKLNEQTLVTINKKLEELGIKDKLKPVQQE